MEIVVGTTALTSRGIENPNQKASRQKLGGTGGRRSTQAQHYGQARNPPTSLENTGALSARRDSLPEQAELNIRGYVCRNEPVLGWLLANREIGLCGRDLKLKDARVETNQSDGTWKETARLELTELQLVISRHEEHAFKVRGFLYAIIGALTTALFLEKPLLTRSVYAGICAVAVMVFMAMELLHRCYAGRAIGRVKNVESALREEQDYDGPKISETMNLTGPVWLRQIQLELSYPTLPLHYLFLGILIFAVVKIGT